MENNGISMRRSVDDVKLPELPSDPEYAALCVEARQAIVDLDRATHYVVKNASKLNPEIIERKALWNRRSEQRVRKNIARYYDDMERASDKIDDIIERLQERLSMSEDELRLLVLHIELLRQAP